ncbi:flagellin N-terminal helical domain-containing protein [Rhodobium gokarnense]|uniref:Flagellin n=1 Tax=Rhodobium gokarnense TaxID=364296 RepID=A0ABT3HD31_9HYPH|nr:flagellin [Rhodobium gokarnense]MCW2308313.1 flagellin-like hook-associated protein FlgL [Rhodobium gokarnense]
MSDITLSAGVRQNLLSLQNTADMMATTQSRLATGKKVNSALDNPTNFFTSQSLNNRASDLSSLLDSMSNGMKTLEAADNGLTSMTKTLESMQSTLRQARQDKSFEKTSYSVDVGSNPAGTEQLTFSGGALGAAEAIDLTTSGGPGTSGTATATYATSSSAFAAATSGAVSATFFSSLTFDDGGDQLNFEIDVDGTGSPASITIDQSIVSGIGNGDNVIADDTELAEAITAAINAEGTFSVGTDLTVTSFMGEVWIQSASSGASASIAISGVGVVDGGGGNTISNTSGLADSAATGLDEEAISFGIDVDGTGSPTTVTIGHSIVQSIGNHDLAIGTIDELQEAIEAGLTEAGVTGVTVSNDGTYITFTSDSQGTSSSVVLSSIEADADGDGTDEGLYGLDSIVSTPGTGEPAFVAKSVDTLVAEINSNSNLEGKIRASNDNGKLRIENQSTNDLTVTGVTASTGTIDGTTGTDTIGGNEVRSDLATQFNDLRDQLDKLSDDSSFNGINLLQGDLLTMTFNETSTSTLDIQSENGETLNSAFLGLSTIEADALDADTDIDALISTVKSALGTIRSQASTFGSNLSMVENREDFTKNMINTLETGADDLVLADTNEEAANMLALQTRQQLSSTALSLASQADQAVLRLF